LTLFLGFAGYGFLMKAISPNFIVFFSKNERFQAVIRIVGFIYKSKPAETNKWLSIDKVLT
jgi:hypothetical protein